MVVENGICTAVVLQSEDKEEDIVGNITSAAAISISAEGSDLEAVAGEKPRRRASKGPDDEPRGNDSSLRACECCCGWLRFNIW